MTKNQDFLRRYVLQKTGKEIAKLAAERVSAIINDPTLKKTEVIRDGGVVHGRMSPIPRGGKYRQGSHRGSPVSTDTRIKGQTYPGNR